MSRRKWVGWIAVGVALVLAPLAIADYQLYWQHHGAILSELQWMPSEDRHPPAAVSSLIEHHYGVNSIDSLIARRLDSEFYEAAGKRLAPNISRGIREILFAKVLQLHLSREERLALFCHRMMFDGGTGLSAGSDRYYGKSPRELSDLEVAGLIAADIHPRSSSPFTHPERFEASRRNVLERTGSR